MRNIVVDSSEVEAEAFPWGSIKWLHNDSTGASELTLGEVVINPGMENPYHKHPNCEEVLYLIEGELMHTCGDEPVVRLKPGMTIRIPRGVAHNAKCISACPARMLVSYSSAKREVTGE